MRHSSLCVVNNRRVAFIGGGGQDAENTKQNDRLIRPAVRISSVWLSLLLS